MIISLSKWPPRRRPNTTGSRTVPTSFLTDAQWARIKDLFENPDPSPKGGRPRIDPRQCLEGILWILRTGSQWKHLPECFPSPATCWRRHRDWTEAGLIVEAWRRLLRDLDRRGRLDWSQAMGMAPFRLQKKGPRGRQDQVGQGNQANADDRREGTPVSAFTASAQVAEVNTIETLVDVMILDKRPDRLLYDKAGDADWIRDALDERGIEQITPHRRGRKKESRQDGRPLRRYKHRWKVERTLSWLGNCRRILVRHEYYAHLFEGFVHWACLLICFKQF